MTLADVIDRVGRSGQTLTVLNHAGPGSALDDLEAHLGVGNVELRAEETASGRPADVALLHDGDGVLAASDAGDVLDAARFDPAAIDPDAFGEISRPEVLRRIDARTFTSYEKGRMVAASREVEQLAWRTGRGELLAGFQRLSRLDEQWPVYEKLGNAGVSARAYGIDDREPGPEHPNVEPVGIDPDGNGEVADVWFVAFRDGDGTGAVLLAEEVEPGRFRGFWSYRGEFVDAVADHVLAEWD